MAACLILDKSGARLQTTATESGISSNRLKNPAWRRWGLRFPLGWLVRWLPSSNWKGIVWVKLWVISLILTSSGRSSMGLSKVVVVDWDRHIWVVGVLLSAYFAKITQKYWPSTTYDLCSAPPPGPKTHLPQKSNCFWEASLENWNFENRKSDNNKRLYVRVWPGSRTGV